MLINFVFFYIQSPIDCRIPLAENLVIIGGGSMLPGLKARLLAEVKDLQQHPKYSSRIALKTLKVHRPPAKSNYVAWLGGMLTISFHNISRFEKPYYFTFTGAVLGATEAIATRSYTRDIYMQTKRVPDWNSLADNVKEVDTRAG